MKPIITNKGVNIMVAHYQDHTDGARIATTHHRNSGSGAFACLLLLAVI